MARGWTISWNWIPQVKWSNLRLVGAISISALTACSHMATTTAYEVDYQDVSLSLATVNTEDQLHHFEYDRAQPLDVAVVDSWRDMNVTVTELTYESPRGEKVPTLLFEPDGEGPFAGLILMHGAPGTKENFKELGVDYARYGFVAVAIDAPQFRSDHNIGHVSMALIWPRFEEKDLEEQSQLILDLQRAVDLLLTLESVDPERLTYIGGSYGGAVGGLFAGVETRLKAYVLKVGDGGIIEHLSEPDEQGYPNHLDRWVNILWPIEPLHFVGRAAPAELLFQNGISDSYVPTSDTLRYYQAASDPKTILWYNTGHFLPARHYYDHLMWQHEQLGVNTILLKPFFGASGLSYDRLLIVWFALSLLSMFVVAWHMRTNGRAGWGAIFQWLLVVLFLGPVGLAAYLYLARRGSANLQIGDSTHALSASLWIVPVAMIGVVIIRQIGFVSILSWQVRGWLFFILPQLFACLAFLIRRLLARSKDEIAPGLAASVLFTLFAATIVSIGAFILIGFVGRPLVPFSFPAYHPVAWLETMLISIVLVLVTWPLHFVLTKWGMVPEEMPGVPVGTQPDTGQVFQWYKPLGLWAGSYLILFAVQAYYGSTVAPAYVKFFDIVKMMFGLEFGV